VGQLAGDARRNAGGALSGGGGARCAATDLASPIRVLGYAQMFITWATSAEAASLASHGRAVLLDKAPDLWPGIH